LPFHFVKAHGWLRGTARGALWTLAVVVVPSLVLEGLFALISSGAGPD
jgi:hypothetical protein